MISKIYIFSGKKIIIVDIQLFDMIFIVVIFRFINTKIRMIIILKRKEKIVFVILDSFFHQHI